MAGRVLTTAAVATRVPACLATLVNIAKVHQQVKQFAHFEKYVRKYILIVVDLKATQ